MHDVFKQLTLIQNKVNDIALKKQLKNSPKIVVVTKKFSIVKIAPLLEKDHLHFAENKIQEAEDKWKSMKSRYKNLQLHMVGSLQSNKAKKAILLFDYIHSLDNEKLATKLHQYQKELNKTVKLFIQVNIADEKQKSGVKLSLLKNFFDFCTKKLSLNIVGLMCLPPIGVDSQNYFKQLKQSADELNLSELSMGMSADFESATLCGSTFLRIGTLIMGERNIT